MSTPHHPCPPLLPSYLPVSSLPLLSLERGASPDYASCSLLLPPNLSCVCICVCMRANIGTQTYMHRDTSHEYRYAHVHTHSFSLSRTHAYRINAHLHIHAYFYTYRHICIHARGAPSCRSRKERAPTILLALSRSLPVSNVYVFCVRMCISSDTYPHTYKQTHQTCMHARM